MRKNRGIKMKKSNEISEIMLKDHLKIDELLKTVKEDMAEGESINELFKKFKWELKRHLIIEERAIFLFYNPPDEKDFIKMFDVIHEHDILLKDMDNVLETDKNKKILELDKLLMKHKTFEDESFYPKLDKELSDFQKEAIIERINSLV